MMMLMLTMLLTTWSSRDLARHQDRMISLVGSAKQMARNCRRLREREGGLEGAVWKFCQ